MADVPRLGPELEPGAALGSGQEVNTRLQPLSGVTMAPAALIVLENRRRKRPIRARLENNLRGGREEQSRGEGEADRQQGGQTHRGRGEPGGGARRARPLYLLPLPPSRSSSYPR